jgi:hypothetical protein
MPKYDLKYPMRPGPSKDADAVAQYEREAVDALNFRALSVEDMLGADAVDGEQHSRLYYMSALSGVAERVLKRMEPADWNGASLVVLKIVNAEN